MRALMAGLAGLLMAVPAAAQDGRGRVEYVAGATIYITVPDANTWAAGDTVRIAAATGADWLGQARVLGVASARLALEWLAGRVPFAAGDSVRIERPRAATPELEPALPPPGAVERGETRGLPAPAAAASHALRASGRIGIELDAARSSAEWIGAAYDNTSVLPSVRLRGAVSGLPGGLRVRANLRGAYRHDDAGVLGPAAQLFANELSLERSGRSVQLQAGRFPNPYEPYSGYWDGALLRVGTLHGAGAGVAYGFEPRYGNQVVDTRRRKAAAFIDVHRYGSTVRYDGDLSVHRSWQDDTVAATGVGWTQQLGIGRVRVSQLLRLDDGADGWTVGLAQLALSAPVGPALRLRLRFTHDDPHAFYRLPAGSAWRTRRLGAALGWFGPDASAGVDAGGAWSELGAAADSADERTARTLGAWLDVPRLPIGVGFDVHASRWTSGDRKTLQVSPGVRRSFGSALLRAGYQLYHQELGPDPVDTHAVSGAFSTRLGRGDVDVSIRHEWGDGIRNTRLLTGYWITL